MGTGKTCETKLRCDLALSLEVAAKEALRDSIHNLATGIRDEGVAWR